MSKPIRQIRVEGNLAYVPLTQGLEVVIDTSDVALVSGTHWYAMRNGKRIYAVRKFRHDDGRRGLFMMHRVIMGEPVGVVVDHKDGDGLNNRRENLRLATFAQNAQNQGLSSRNKSGFKGVSYCRDKVLRRWKAMISLRGRNIFVGYFDTPEAASAAYRAAAIKLHGDFARFE